MKKGRENRQATFRSFALHRWVQFPTAVLACFIIYSALAGCDGERLRWEEINREIDAKFPQSRSISVEELRSRPGSGEDLILVDVREPEEYTVSRIEGATNMQSAEDIRGEFANVEKSIVLYCSVGYRSGDLASRLRRNGMENVYNLRGSIFKWANEGLPLVNDSGETSYVHPYDEYWGELLERRRHRYRPEDG